VLRKISKQLGGGELINWGCTQESSSRSLWAATTSISPINRGRGLSLRVQHFFAISFHLILVRRRRKKEKI